MRTCQGTVGRIPQFPSSRPGVGGGIDPSRPARRKIRASVEVLREQCDRGREKLLDPIETGRVTRPQEDLGVGRRIRWNASFYQFPSERIVSEIGAAREIVDHSGLALPFEHEIGTIHGDGQSKIRRFDHARFLVGIVVRFHARVGRVAIAVRVVESKIIDRNLIEQAGEELSVEELVRAENPASVGRLGHSLTATLLDTVDVEADRRI